MATSSRAWAMQVTGCLAPNNAGRVTRHRECPRLFFKQVEGGDAFDTGLGRGPVLAELGRCNRPDCDGLWRATGTSCGVLYRRTPCRQPGLRFQARRVQRIRKLSAAPYARPHPSVRLSTDLWRPSDGTIGLVTCAEGTAQTIAAGRGKIGCYADAPVAERFRVVGGGTVVLCTRGDGNLATARAPGCDAEGRPDATRRCDPGKGQPPAAQRDRDARLSQPAKRLHARLGR